MHRRFLPMTFAAVSLAALGIALTGAEARGQEEGFRYAKPKAAPKVAKSARIHRDLSEVTLTDAWVVRQSSLPGANHRDITAIVESVTLSSNGKMRWNYSIYNRGSSGTNFIFDFPNCYVVDQEGDTYKATAWEKTQNYGTMTQVGLPAGGKANFWIEYDAPTRPTKAFKVALVCEGGFSTRPNEFAPFKVPLTPPMSFGEGKAEPKEAPEPEATDGLKLDDAAPMAERPGGMTKLPEGRPLSPPKPSSPAAQAVLAASRDGRRYEGSILGEAGGEASGGILFERRSKNRLLSARIYRKTGPKKEPIKLVGAIYEDIAAPGGLVFRFEDLEEVEYLFSVEGGNFSGTDTRGNRYSFLYKK